MAGLRKGSRRYGRFAKGDATATAALRKGSYGSDGFAKGHEFTRAERAPPLRPACERASGGATGLRKGTSLLVPEGHPVRYAGLQPLALAAAKAAGRSRAQAARINPCPFAPRKSAGSR